MKNSSSVLSRRRIVAPRLDQAFQCGTGESAPLSDLCDLSAVSRFHRTPKGVRLNSLASTMMHAPKLAREDTNRSAIVEIRLIIGYFLMLVFGVAIALLARNILQKRRLHRKIMRGYRPRSSSRFATRD
jgi:hypothetical protein